MLAVLSVVTSCVQIPHDLLYLPRILNSFESMLTSLVQEDGFTELSVESDNLEFLGEKV